MLKAILVILCLTTMGIAQESTSRRVVVCKGKKVSFDLSTTIVQESKDNIGWNSVLNGHAITLVKPSYPYSLTDQRIRASSSVQVLIDRKGNVISAEAVSGPDIFRPLSVKAVQASKFKRLIRDCKPLKYSGVVIYLYEPEKGK